MIIADENIDHSIISALRGIELDVFSIYETERSSLDFDIIQFSRNPPRIILTEDKDFGEWVFAHHIKGISIVFLRYSFQETDKIIVILKRIFANPVDLLGKFTTITTQKNRSREI